MNESPIVALNQNLIAVHKAINKNLRDVHINMQNQNDLLIKY